eukprot:CAMPEP_0170086692 /NCGR_PEP_ID=MMETSP0019_2-20121128/21313_1 /TAXON_ID=98059 /ORGANISM="Dinobryon sp., Strain UTEXLB2267" /LENGTH=655 /DNA_ID=CAMNT_0010303883 /DNA_START=864 /DNA_END=2831 /DNA_ORIENTATION=+
MAIFIIHSFSSSIGSANVVSTPSIDWLLSIVIVRIFLTNILKVIPTRCYKLSSELKQEALENRLNLIRYLSHEMRTPLNTVFIGLDYIITEMQRVKEELLILSKAQQSVDCMEVCSPKSTGSDTFSLEQINDVLSTSNHVLDSCHIALETLNDLLTLDKIGDGKFVISATIHNPVKLVRSCAGPFSINAHEKNICFNIFNHDRSIDQNEAIDSEVGIQNHEMEEYFIEVDEFKICQVIRNLLSNALKFSPRDGTVKVITEVFKYDAKTSKVTGNATNNMKFDRIVRVSVMDNGPGISLEDQKKLFGKYVQFNAGALQSGKGSGLGLWISRSIVEMHGGVLNAHSDGEGKGSVFFMELPLYLKKNCNRDLSDDVCFSLDGSSKRDVTEGHSDSDFLNSMDRKDVSVHNSSMELTDAYSTVDVKICSTHNPNKQSPSNSTSIVKKKVPTIRAPPQLGLLPKKKHPALRRSFSGLSADNRVFVSANDCKEWRAGLNILIVDDSLTNRKVMMKLLSSYGHTISEAVDGLDFLRIMGCNMNSVTRRTSHASSMSATSVKTAFFEPLPPTPYNVILMDDNMPNMNGSEAVEIIRQHGYRGLIVGISGDIDPSCIERFKKKGVNDVMPKPIDVDQLKMNIEQFLRSQNDCASSAESTSIQLS